MHMEEVFTAVAVGFEAIGAAAMIIGFLIALVLGLRSLQRGEGGRAAFTVLRTTLGAAILLGLEVLVAADLIRTITSKPSMEDAAILGLIVLIRTILSMSIQVEIEGTLPWRRALLTSGGQMLGQAVKTDLSADCRSGAHQALVAASEPVNPLQSAMIRRTLEGTEGVDHVDRSHRVRVTSTRSRRAGGTQSGTKRLPSATPRSPRSNCC